MLAILLACVGKTTPPVDTASTEEDAGPDASWGVTTACEGRHRGGYNDWFEAGTGRFVVGDDPLDLETAASFASFYGEYVDVEVVDAATLEDRAGNLAIVGSPASNPLLAELAGELPVWFEDDGFWFGGHHYTEHGHGVTLLARSPWDAGAWLLLFAGNSGDAVYSLMTVPTGGDGFVTTRGGWTEMQRGDLCEDDRFYADYADDAWPGWEAWTAQLAETATDTHVFRYPPGSDAEAAVVDWLPGQRAAALADTVALLEVEPLDLPVTAYLYPDNDTKGEVTGESGNAHANPLNREVHEVLSADVMAATGHEDVHVVQWARIGWTDHALLGEGMAVWAGGEWWGEPLDDWAETYAAQGEVPALADLVDAFRSTDDGVSYPLAGHFVAFLAETYDIDTVKRLYVADDLHAAFEDELGLTTDELDAAWRASF